MMGFLLVHCNGGALVLDLLVYFILKSMDTKFLLIF